MSEGYIYCLTNPTLPDDVIVDMTKKSPIEVLAAANNSPWGPKKPYVLEFAIKVSNVKNKIAKLYAVLDDRYRRVEKVPPTYTTMVSSVYSLCELMDGEMWKKEDPVEKAQAEQRRQGRLLEDAEEQSYNINTEYRMYRYFPDDTSVSHTFKNKDGKTIQKLARYNQTTNTLTLATYSRSYEYLIPINDNGKTNEYHSMTSFVMDNYKKENIEYPSNINAWDLCDSCTNFFPRRWGKASELYKEYISSISKEDSDDEDN